MRIKIVCRSCVSQRLSWTSVIDVSMMALALFVSCQRLLALIDTSIKGLWAQTHNSHQQRSHNPYIICHCHYSSLKLRHQQDCSSETLHPTPQLLNTSESSIMFHIHDQHFSLLTLPDILHFQNTHIALHLPLLLILLRPLTCYSSVQTSIHNQTESNNGNVVAVHVH